MSVENKGEIRVAIVGVGNCANSLIQGITYYKDATNETEIPGLMHPVLGGYHIKNINFVLALDVDAKKVGLDLADAIWASENNTIKFATVAKTGVTVKRGTTLDGLGRYYKETIKESDAAPVDVVAELKANKVDVLICYLPVGSEEAAKFYAQCAIDAGCAFVNALPVLLHLIQYGQISSQRLACQLLVMILNLRLAPLSLTELWPSFFKIAVFT